MRGCLTSGEIMTQTNGASTSIWMSDARLPEYGPLQDDLQADVCVIGGGIAGLTTAYLLSREDLRVVLIDAFGIGAGETGRTTAHFFPPDEWYADLEQGFGGGNARLVAQAFARAIELVQTIVEHERIDCGFERLDGYLYALPGNGFKDLRREYEAARRAGADVELLERVPGLSFDSGPCVRYRSQAQFHPLRYLNGLAEAFVRRGGRICGRTRALEIRASGTARTVVTPAGTITCGSVVVATNTPFNNRVVMHTKQAGYRTYVIGVRVPRGSVPRILLWDTGDPYYYLRLQSPEDVDDHDVLIVGGADHKVGTDSHPGHRYDEIERWVRERFPMAGAVAYRWSGEVMEPSDGPAYLGHNPMDDRNVYIITGDSGNGMTHATIGAMIIRDQITGRPNPWAPFYAPSRKVRHGLSDFMHEQADTLSHYGDWARAGEVRSPAEIAAGEGAVLGQGRHKLAVYRDESGALHTLSARCTHLGCVVHWNAAEKSWDCPCHGSRFAIDGEVLHGPAPSALEAAGLPDPAPVVSERSGRAQQDREDRR